LHQEKSKYKIVKISNKYTKSFKINQIFRLIRYNYLGMTRRKKRVGLSAIFPINKTTAKKPCFSKSGDTAPIPHAALVFITNLRFYRFIRNPKKPTFA
jgi:hypothetical protein